MQVQVHLPKLQLILSNFVCMLINLYPIYLDIRRFSDSFILLILIEIDSVYAAISPHFLLKHRFSRHGVTWDIINFATVHLINKCNNNRQMMLY